MAETLFSGQAPSNGNVDEGTALSVGTTMVFAEDGTVSAVSFIVPATNTGTYTVELYRCESDDAGAAGTGTLLGSASVGSGSVVAGTRHTVPITPVAVTGVTEAYRACVHATSGRFVTTSNFFTSPLVNGNITGIQSGTDPVGLGTLRNGTFRDTATPAYPSGHFNSGNYFVDVEYTAGATVDGALAATAPSSAASLGGTLVDPAALVAAAPSATAAAEASSRTDAALASTITTSSAATGTLANASALAATAPAATVSLTATLPGGINRPTGTATGRPAGTAVARPATTAVPRPEYEGG